MEKEVVIYFLGFMFCLTNIVYIYFILNSKKFSFSLRLLIYILSLSLMATVLYKLNIIFLKSIISLIALYIILFFCYKEEKKKAFNYSLFIWLCGMLLDLLIMNFSSLLFKFFPKKILNDYSFLIMFGFTIIVQVVHNLIARIKKVKNFMIKADNLLNKLKFNFFIDLIFIMVFIFIGVLAFRNLDNLNFVLCCLVFCSLLAYLKFNNIYLKYKCYTLNESNLILIDNNRFYTEINMDSRIFRHNLIHRLNGLKINTNKKSNEIIDDIIYDCSLLTKTDKEIEKLPFGLDGLIYQKLYAKSYKDLNVFVNNDIKSDFYENLKARNYNKFCESLGVALDNALEASLESKEKALLLLLDEDELTYNVTIQNTFGHELDMERIGEVNYTTKTKGHGLGLFSIFLQDKIKIKTKIVNNIFVVNISVNKIKI